jgi:hypothetical protein
MICLVKVLAGISLSAFTVAALIGFTKPEDTDNCFSKLAVCIKKMLKCQCLNKPYSLTRIGLIIGFIFGIVSIAFS